FPTRRSSDLVPNRRSDQSPLDSDGDPDVDRVDDPDPVALQLRIHHRMLLERLSGRLDEDVVVAEARLRAGRLDQLDNGPDFCLADQGDMGRLPLTLRETL